MGTLENHLKLYEKFRQDAENKENYDQKMIIEAIKKELRALDGIESAILFGSYARGDMNDKSDIDLCITTSDKKKERKISEKILDLEKKLNKNIQVVFADPDFTDQDPNFVENLLREGKLLAGKMPTPSLKKVGLEPYFIIKYSLQGLTQPEKMKVMRILYGKNTTKKYKDKTYLSQKQGLTAKKAEKIGRGSLLLAQDTAALIEKTLQEHKIPYRKIPAWVPKI